MVDWELIAVNPASSSSTSGLLSIHKHQQQHQYRYQHQQKHHAHVQHQHRDEHVHERDHASADEKRRGSTKSPNPIPSNRPSNHLSPTPQVINGGEAEWDREQIQAFSKEVVRSWPCRWTGRDGMACDAIMASHKLLAKHVHMHIDRAFAQQSASDASNAGGHGEVAEENDDDELDLIPRRKTVDCGWANCRSPFPDAKSLTRHVDSLHLEKVNRYCPFRDCDDRRMQYAASLPSHYSNQRRHPKPWTPTNTPLLPTPFAKLTPPIPPPLAFSSSAYAKTNLGVKLSPSSPSAPTSNAHMPSEPSEELLVPPYLLSSAIVRPFPKGVPVPHRPPPSNHHGDPLYPPRIAMLHSLHLPLIPDRSEDIPFYPTCGEAPPGLFVRFSCSIFPPNKTEDGTKACLPKTDDKGQIIVPKTDKQGKVEMSVRKRKMNDMGSVLEGRPRLAVPPHHPMAHQKKQRQTQEREEKDVKVIRTLKIKLNLGGGRAVQLSNDGERPTHAHGGIANHDELESHLGPERRSALAFDIDGDAGQRSTTGEENEDDLRDKGKGKELRFSTERVRRAAMREARRRVGRSVGVDFWMEVAQFEAEGVAFGLMEG